MSTSKHSVSHEFQPFHGNLRVYVFGFAASIILTLSAFVMVMGHELSRAGVMIGIFVLAIVQLFIQLVCFLHLGREARPRWNLIAFGFALMVVVIVVVGSLWIMHNLNYNMSSPAQTNAYLDKQDSL